MTTALIANTMSGRRVPHTAEDWNRGEKVDYRANQLGRPPEGHEWRRIDGNYVLANHDGTIASVRHTSRNHEPSHDQHP